ncbi:uncharacterized protein TrAtP1_013078 [Trichoderma atroviride]|uniref:uncharacterized protein n=1 Tax=Hypocrea atroviridis TaxID=63577 RepID=UPI003323E087|nr:hypothetical protein TrAtP1_013078 [Trichoderma atroviride]
MTAHASSKLEASPELLATTAWLKRHISRLQSLIANRHVQDTGATVLDDPSSMRFSQDSPPRDPNSLLECSSALTPPLSVSASHDRSVQSNQCADTSSWASLSSSSIA